MEMHELDDSWDVFISHASEDKEMVARPLAEALRSRGLKVWYDEFSLELGDSLRRSIDWGLARSRYGVVILSHSFFAKEWPQRELDGLNSREIGGGKVILPVWHDITHPDIVRYSPTLADRLAANTTNGISKVADSIESLLREDAHATNRTHEATSLESDAGQKITGVAAQVLRFILEAALDGGDDAPEVDDVMAHLNVSAEAYADAVEELASLNLVYTQGNGNHASGYARAGLLPQTLILVGEQVRPELDLRAEVEEVLEIFGRSRREYELSQTIAASTTIPVPRLQLIVDFLREADLVEARGMGIPNNLDFAYGRLTPRGRRVGRGDEPIPIMGTVVRVPNRAL